MQQIDDTDDDTGFEGGQQVGCSEAQSTHAQLNSLRDRANVYRKLIKSNYLPDQWERFGLMDKR